MTNISTTLSDTSATAELHDLFMADSSVRMQVAAPGLVSFGGRKTYNGRITTVAALPGGVPPRLRDILAEPGDGRVLVVEGQGAAAQWALLGDRMASVGLENGWAGVVIHGYIRDVAVLRDLPFGVHALGCIPSRPHWAEHVPVDRDVPLAFHRVRFHPGYWLYADEDGLIVTEQELVSRT